MRRTTLIACAFVLMTIGVPSAFGQATNKTIKPLKFEVATIKPCPPGGQSRIGFHSYPGGRVEIIGFSVKVLASLAFDVQPYQVSRGPDWAGTDCYNVAAEPPDSSPSRTAQQTPESWTPTKEQRQMLQNLLADRFGLRFHRETKQGPVYILTRSNKTLQLKDSEDKDREPVFVVFVRGNIADGEVRGANVSMPYVANGLASNLLSPVLDRTGLQGSYDLHVQPFDAENRDVEAAISGAMDRLGLKLKRAIGPFEAIVIDHIERPSEN